MAAGAYEGDASASPELGVEVFLHRVVQTVRRAWLVP